MCVIVSSVKSPVLNDCFIRGIYEVFNLLTKIAGICVNIKVCSIRILTYWFAMLLVNQTTLYQSLHQSLFI